MASGFISRFNGKILASRASLGKFGPAEFGFSGNLYNYVSAGINPGATAADNVLASYLLPANAFDILGRRLLITAQGNFASNTSVKTTKIIIGSASATVGSTIGTGGTTVATSGAYSTTGACGWLLQATVAKYGINGSNTQMSQETATIISATHGGIGVCTALTLAENAPIWIAVTGNAATTATDVSLMVFEVNAAN